MHGTDDRKVLTWQSKIMGYSYLTGNGGAWSTFRSCKSLLQKISIFSYSIFRKQIMNKWAIVHSYVEFINKMYLSIWTFKTMVLNHQQSKLWWNRHVFFLPQSLSFGTNSYSDIDGGYVQPQCWNHGYPGSEKKWPETHSHVVGCSQPNS